MYSIRFGCMAWGMGIDFTKNEIKLKFSSFILAICANCYIKEDFRKAHGMNVLCKFSESQINIPPSFKMYVTTSVVHTIEIDL